MRELALHILDILQNTVEAGASQVELTIDEDPGSDRLAVMVRDNGRGMDTATAARSVNPFFTSRTTRHVGLGLPLLAAATERAGGQLSIQSRPGHGTTVTASFQLSHPDRQPLGDMGSTLLTFLLSEKAVDLRYSHRTGAGTFDLDTAAIRGELGDELDFANPVVRQWLAGFLQEGEQAVRTF